MAGKAHSTSRSFGLFGAAIAAAGVSVAVASVKMADQFETSNAKMRQAFRNVGTSADVYKGQIAVVSKQMEGFGFTNAQTEEALANLTTALRSPQKAFKDIGLAADLAKFKHIDLASAATIVAKAEEGNLRVIKQLGVDLPITGGGAAKLLAAHTALATATTHLNQLEDVQHTKAKLTLADHLALTNAQAKVAAAQTKVNQLAYEGTYIHQQLAKILGGQAAAAAETFAGKEAKVKAEVQDLGVKIGMALIPLLEKAASGLATFGGWVQRNTSWLKPLAVAVGAVGVGFAVYAGTVKVVTAVTKTWAVVQALLNGEMDANPIGLVVIAVAALAAGLIYAYKHSATFRHIVNGTFHDVLVSAKAVAGFFSGPFVRVVGSMVSIVVKGFKFVADVWFTVVGGLINGAAKAFGWVPGIGGKLKSAARAFNDFHHSVDTELSGIAATAATWGHNVGTAFDNGIIGGLTSKQQAVYSASQGIAASVLTGAKGGLRIASPSKAGLEIGRNFGNSIAIGIGEKVSTVTAAVQNLVSKLLSKLDTLKGDRAGLISGIVGNLTGGASLANLPTSTTDSLGASMNVPPSAEGIRHYLSSYLGQENAEKRNLGLAGKHGLAPAVAAQIAQMGLDQGGPFAAAFGHASKSQIKQIDLLEAGIGTTATQIGTSIGNQTYNKDIAKQTKLLEEAQRELKLANEYAKRGVVHFTDADIEKFARAIVPPPVDHKKRAHARGRAILAHT